MQAQVDVGSGNLLVTVRGVALPDVNRQVQLGAFYNSAASQAAAVPRLGRGWGLDYSPDVRVVDNLDGSVTYHASGGRVGVFTLASGSTTAYASPGGFKMTLVKAAGGWRLTEHDSQDVLRFGGAGGLESITDRNGNATTITASGSTPFRDLTVQTPAGTTRARTATVRTEANGNTAIFHGGTDTLRTVRFGRNGSDAASFSDALGRNTDFGYDSTGLLTQISAPGSVTTRFGYDAQRRVTSITQVNGSGPGDSVTRLAYPSATTTLLASPQTDQSQPVASVPRTTYTLNAAQRVTRAVDAAGREQAATYTANFDTASATQGTGAAASTTTNTWGANAGQSLTRSQSGQGSGRSLTYANTSGPAQYLPARGTDDAGNASTFTYNGAGNQLTSTNAGAAQNQVSYNADGTAATATAPGNGTNVTRYGYTNKQPTSMTPVIGSSLGARAYGYDDLGRLRSATNGRGITTTYSYNLNDQVTEVRYSDGSVITYGYDSAGRNNQRAENSGTVTMDYDQLGRMTGRQNSAGGGQLSYTYDRSSRLTSSTSVVGGTVRYSYDNADVPTAVEYPQAGGGTAQMRFAVDNQGRRTGTYLGANAALTFWGGRSLNTYDRSGRVSRVTADLGAGTANIVDINYCYTAGTTPAGGCTTGTATTDRDKLQWERDALTGRATTYTYDTSGRLTRAAVSGTGATTYAYGYDAKNNRTAATRTGASTGSEPLAFNAASQITSTGFGYDAAGNMTADPTAGLSNIGYTAADQLRTVTKNGTAYTYTHGGVDNNELLEQSTPEGTYRYTYGRNAATGVPTVEQVQKVDGATTNASVISDPVTGTPLMLRTNSGQQNMYVYDGTPGAPIALISSGSQQQAGYDYDPYGVPVITNSTNTETITANPYTFGGTGVRDRTTDWVHYGARYYSTRTGAFTQQDTLDVPLDPANANRYAYAGGDPINNIDPTGFLSAEEVSLGLGVASLGLGVAGIIATGPVAVGLGAVSFATGGPGVAIGAGCYVSGDC